MFDKLNKHYHFSNSKKDIEVNTVCVMGLGYIGLPTAAILANRGYNVYGVDTNESVVKVINKGEIHIVEPDLDVFVRAAVDSGRLQAYLEPAAADVFIISVPTPFYKGQEGEIPKPNIEYVISAVRSIAPYVKSGNIVILESTSPVGTTEILTKELKAQGVDIDSIFVAYCPERVLPGNMMIELVENDRIVGGINVESVEKVKKFYETFVVGEVLTTDSKTAEMCKLVENSSRDVQIAFANELSMICDDLDINVWELIRLANHHPRVNILNPGCGVGGHCIAVDPWFIVDKVPARAQIIKKARDINNYKSEWVIEKTKNTILEFKIKNGENPNVVCMGLAFKPDIDDLRESPALSITKALLEDGFVLKACEPNIESIEGIDLISVDEAVEFADIFVMLVGHKEFRLNIQQIHAKIVLDFCGVNV